MSCPCHASCHPCFLTHGQRSLRVTSLYRFVMTSFCILFVKDEPQTAHLKVRQPRPYSDAATLNISRADCNMVLGLRTSQNRSR
jgi:hypothetical protein